MNLDLHDPMWSLAWSLENTVRTVRKAQGRLNPEDCAYGSTEHEEIAVAFLKDLMRLMSDDPRAIDDGDEQDDAGVGALPVV